MFLWAIPFVRTVRMIQSEMGFFHERFSQIRQTTTMYDIYALIDLKEQIGLTTEFSLVGQFWIIESTLRQDPFKLC